VSAHALPPGISDVIPPNGFLRSYVTYCAQATDAPEVYHVAAGLATLAGAVADKLPFRLVGDRPTYPNMWSVLLGQSRAARKTTSVNLGAEMLADAAPVRVLPDAGSFEQLVDEIQATPTGLIVHPEFAHFLKTTERGYAAPLRTLLMQLYDCPRRFTRTLKKKKIVIETPIVLSMSAACATPLLCAYTDDLDWTGGFLPRCLLVYAERERLALPLGDDAWRQQLVAWLANAVQRPVPVCGGLDEEARRYLFDWQITIERDAPRTEPHWSFCCAFPMLAAKMAVLYAFDSEEHERLGPGWTVHPWYVWLAIEFLTKQYLPRLAAMFERVTLNPFERSRQRAIDAIRDGGPTGRPRAAVIRHTRISAREFGEVLDTLIGEEIALESRDARGVVYVLRELAHNGVAATNGTNGATRYTTVGLPQDMPATSRVDSTGFPQP